MKYFSKIVFCFFSLALSFSTTAKNIGVVGKIFTIKEMSMIELIHAKYQKKIDDGSWGKEVEAMKKLAKSRVARPLGVSLPKATESTVHYYNPSVVLTENVVDHKGNILYLSGTKANPLNYVSLSNPIIFFDADDSAQLIWAKKHLDKNRNLRVILTNGPILELMSKWKKHLYFDQKGIYTKKLLITALPAFVDQEDVFLKVAQIALIDTKEREK